MDTRDAEGFTLIELLIVVAIIGIIAALAVPGLLRARMSGNEASAIGSLRAINSSQQAFSSTCGNAFYASDLSDLGRAPGAGGAPFISPDLSVAPVVTKSGYQMSMAAGSDGSAGTIDACNAVAGARLSSTYYVSAHPLVLNSTGTRYFWTNALGTIYSNTATIVDTVGAATPSGGKPLQ